MVCLIKVSAFSLKSEISMMKLKLKLTLVLRIIYCKFVMFIVTTGVLFGGKNLSYLS